MHESTNGSFNNESEHDDIENEMKEIIERLEKKKSERNQQKKNINKKVINPRPRTNNSLLCKVNNCKIKNELTSLIYKRIQQHIVKDKRRFKNFNEDDYITVIDVLNLLKNQENKCNFCDEEVNLKPTHTQKSRDLNAFSIDRINNKKPHTKTNCVISCFYCNANRDCYGSLTKDEIIQHKKNGIQLNFKKEGIQLNKEQKDSKISPDEFDYSNSKDMNIKENIPKWTDNIPKLNHKVGSENGWHQEKKCIYCDRAKYNPVFYYGFRQICKICLGCYIDEIALIFNKNKI